MTWSLDKLGDLDFGQLVYSNYWETCVLKNLFTWGQLGLWATWTLSNLDFGNLGNLNFGSLGNLDFEQLG